MIGYYRIQPKSQTALKIISIHGDVMGVDVQRSNEVLLWCATPTCKCWATRRYRNWFKLNIDVVLGNAVPQPTPPETVQAELDTATSIAN